MKVYICGGRECNTDFESVELILREKGYIPINPIKVIRSLPDEITNADFTVLSYELIRLCDAIYLINDWEKSLFARMEMSYAKRLEKIVIGGDTCE